MLSKWIPVQDEMYGAKNGNKGELPTDTMQTSLHMTQAQQWSEVYENEKQDVLRQSIHTRHALRLTVIHDNEEENEEAAMQWTAKGQIAEQKMQPRNEEYKKAKRQVTASNTNAKTMTVWRVETPRTKTHRVLGRLHEKNQNDGRNDDNNNDD